MANVTVSTLRRYAEKRACSLDFERADGQYQIILDAPHRKIFVSSGCHCDCSLHGNGWFEKPDWNRTLREMQEIIAMGFYDCDDPDCDTCTEAPE